MIIPFNQKPMIRFVKYEFGRLIDFKYAIIIFLTCSIAWYSALPPFNHRIIFNTSSVIDNYLRILSFYGFPAFALIMTSHLNMAMMRSGREILGTKLSEGGYFWGLFVVYFLFYIFGFILPGFMIAMVQQIIYVPDHLNQFVFLLRLAALFCGFIYFPVFLCLVVYIRFQNDLLTLIIISLFLSGLFVFSGLTGINIIYGSWLVFNMYGDKILSISLISLMLWIIHMVFMFAAGKKMQKGIFTNRIQLPAKSSLFTSLAEKINSRLTMYHINMLNLRQEKLLITTTLILFVILILLNRKLDYQLNLLVNIALVLLSTVYACHQSSILNPGKISESMDILLTKSTPVSKVILNRWCISLFQQLGFLALAYLITATLSHKIDTLVMLYIGLLGLFSSVFIFFLYTNIRLNNLAYIFLFLLIYIHLNENTKYALKSLGLPNVFDPVFLPHVLHEIYPWVILAGLNIILIFLSALLLNKSPYGYPGYSSYI